MAANSVHLTEPLSVSDINKLANNFPYDDQVPFRMWFRSADHILKQAQSYRRDEEYQQAYIFYLRHATLLLEKLPKHPQAGEVTNRKMLLRATRLAETDLRILEDLKPRIAQRYAEYVKAQTARQMERDQIAAERQRKGESPAGQQLPHFQGSSALGRRRQLAAEEHGDLALQLVQTETRRRQAEQSQLVGQFEGLGVEEPRKPRKRHSLKGDVHDLSKAIMDVGRKGQYVMFDKHNAHRPIDAGSGTSLGHYPTIPQKREHYVPPALHKLDNTPVRLDDRADLPPSRPPKEFGLYGVPPAVPSKVVEYRAGTTEADENGTVALVNSKDYAFKPSAFTEDGTPLRTVWLPPQLRLKFLSLAEPNTRLNQEFLGILCGTLISNAFFITRLVIPQQKASSDTCEMIEEGEISLMEYCEAEDLMTLGWVHTHPTQTCFMSSRDLHTHSAYQLQLAESIAMVCAPSKDPSWGIFRLTSPPGLQHIRDCRLPGIFHPHALPDRDLYTTDGMPSHVKELARLDFEVVDLRK